MRLTLAYVRAGTLELARYPAFSVPTVFFPTLVFLLFALPYADDDPNVVMAGFAATALLGVAFFQFGVAIAIDRVSPWETLLRTLPVRPGTRLAARVGSALLFSLVSGSLVIVTASLTTAVSLPAERWVALVGALLLGSIPLALLGIALGYWIRPKAALPVANLLFLPLAYAGGLWAGPRRLPDSLAAVSPFLPTRHWGEVLWAAVGYREWRAGHLLALAGFAVLFGCLALWGYRRDEGERYR